MPGIASLLHLGQPDPAQQIAAMLSGQQPPPGGPQGPQGAVLPPGAPNAALAPPGPPGAAPVNPNAPAPNAQPVSADPNAPNVAPGAQPPPGTQPSPMAYQSSPDMAASYSALANPPNLMSLYAQLYARDRSDDQFNRGIALIAANHSSPEMARAIMGSVSGNTNSSGMVGDLMSLYSAQQQMGAQQSMLGQADAIDKKLGLPPGTARNEILMGRGPDLVAKMEPTEMARNYDWARKTYSDAHPGATADEIAEGAQGILLGMGSGGGDADTKSWRNAKLQWDSNLATKGTPYPWGTGPDDSPTRFRAWSGAQVEADKATQADLTEAAKLGPTYRQNLQGTRDRVASIIGLQSDGSIDPTREEQLRKLLGKPMAQKYVNSDPTKEGTWGQELSAWWGDLQPEDRALLTQIRDATDEKTLIGGLKNRAPKRGTSDVSDIGIGLGGMRNVTQGYTDWVNGAKDTIKSLDTATVNSFGAQGTPEQAEDYALKHHMPGEAVTNMDDNYLPGGAMYPKGKFQGTLTQPQIDAAAAAIKGADDPDAELQRQIKLAKIRGLDPTPLKNLRK